MTTFKIKKGVLRKCKSDEGKVVIPAEVTEIYDTATAPCED